MIGVPIVVLICLIISVIFAVIDGAVRSWHPWALWGILIAVGGAAMAGALH